MDLDDILGQFGEKPKSSVGKSTFDVDSILSEFGGKPEIKIEDKPRLIVTKSPKPPISGISKESSDELNETRIERFGGENPRSRLPTTSIVEDIVGNAKAGRNMVSSGLEDLSSNKPASGVGKVALGSLQAITAPVTGLIEGGISKPISDITGSKEIGDKAGFIAESAIPVVPTAGVITKIIPKNKMLSRLIEHIGPDELPAVVSAMKTNPRLAPADLSPKVLQSTQELFANGGAPVNYLKNTSDARMATRKDTIREAYDTSAGISPDLAKKVSDLANSAKKVGSEKINPIVASAGPVNVSSTIEAIDKILKPGVNSVITSESSLPLTAVKKELAQIKTMLGNDKEMRTNAADLHKFQSGLRSTASSLLKSGTSADREMGKALMSIRTSLVADIDKSAKGYKDALHAYRDEMHIADAFKKGHDDIFTSSTKLENDPSFTKKWFDGLSDYEKKAATEGARAAIYTKMGVAENSALAGERMGRSDFNKAKMEILFGKEETEALLKKLESERAIANTHNKVIEGSQTAMRADTKSEWKRPDKSKLDNVVPYMAEALGAYTTGVPAVGALTYQGLKGVNLVAHKIKTAIARENEAQYAKYALPVEGPSRDALIKSLEAAIPGPKLSMLNRVKASLPVGP